MHHAEHLPVASTTMISKPSEPSNPMLNYRVIHLLLFSACAALLATAYYMEYVLWLAPCPLCILQRIVFVAIGLTALATALHLPGPKGRFRYSTLIIVFSVIGALLAGRHTWLQHLPPDKVPECFPDIGIIFMNNSLMDALAIMFGGTGECAEVAWSFLGLSIPEWTLISYIGFAVIAIWQMRQHKALQADASGQV